MIAPSIADYIHLLKIRQPYYQGGSKPLRTGKNGLPLITIITVVLNAESSLKKTLQSVIDQSYPYVEYLVIDGGSTDQTLALIQEQNDHITHWRSEPDKGLYDAMNKGIAMSHGDLIGILNAGDYLESEALFVLGTEYSRQSKPTIITCDCKIILSAQNHWIESGNASKLPKQMIPHGSVFVDQIVYREQGLFSLNYRVASDYDFLCRCRQKVYFHYIDRTIATISPRGVSGNYYLTEFEYLHIRWQNNLMPIPLATWLSVLSFFKITAHLVLEWLGLWQIIETRKYAQFR